MKKVVLAIALIAAPLVIFQGCRPGEQIELSPKTMKEVAAKYQLKVVEVSPEQKSQFAVFNSAAEAEAALKKFMANKKTSFSGRLTKKEMETFNAAALRKTNSKISLKGKTLDYVGWDDEILDDERPGKRLTSNA